MKRADLFHPRVFDDPEWAEGYYRRNVKNIERVGLRFAQLLKNSGFSGGKILDAGCGFGAVAIELAQQFPEAEIVGIDLGEPLLKLGRLLVEQAGVADRISLKTGNIHSLDFESNSFDLVVNTFMVHVVEHPVTMLNEIERVAAPAGRIILTDLRRNWLALLVKKFKTAFTLKEGKKILAQSKLRPGKFSTGLYWWDYMSGLNEDGPGRV
jgi:ubiquinone/menaquinone biosynthesis C-methylase UbiE